MAKIPYKKNEPLASKSTFKIGCTADIYITPQTTEELQRAASASVAAEENFFILGGGSNIVFPDEPYSHLLISTENLNNILMTDDLPEDLSDNQVLVTCQCGTPVATFVNFCTKHNLSGAEQFAGLPGSIGGATYMNARCFDKSFSDIIYETHHIELHSRGNSKIINMKFNSSDWDYKKSPFQTVQDEPQKIITETTFILKQCTAAEHQNIEDSCKHYIKERVDKGHFKYPSAGSVFKNNHTFGKPSGKLIDEAGLKGYQIGGAQIAPFHGNFIINTNNAKAEDVQKLVELATTTVKDKFGFNLEPEIIFIKN